MNKRFQDAKRYEKTICAVIAIFTFLCLWQFVVSFTKVGVVMAGPVTVLGRFLTSLLEPIGTHTIEVHIFGALPELWWDLCWVHWPELLREL